MNINEALENIKKGHDLPENLPVFATAMADSYMIHDTTELAFNFVMLYQAVSALSDNENEKKYLSHFNEIVKRGVLADFDGERRETCISEAAALRDEIEKRHDDLSVIMSYLDMYRYIFIRKVKREEDQADPDDAARKILRYIFDSNDNNVINTKIQSVISELPVRYTRTKFYEILDDAVNKYAGGEKSALDTFTFLVRRWGTLDDTKEASDMYPEYWSVVKELSEGGEESDPQKLLDKTIETSKAALVVGNIHELFANAINSLITVLLVRPYSMNADVDDAINVINITSDAVSSLDKDSSMDEYEERIADALRGLEGLEERHYSEHNRLQSVLSDIRESYMDEAENIMAGAEIRDLAMCLNLNSGNLFAPMASEEGSAVLTSDDLTAAKEALHEAFRERFTDTDIYEKRAVMAGVLGILPVYFNNRSEVMDYVRSSLSYINDDNEYAGSIAAINELITE